MSRSHRRRGDHNSYSSSSGPKRSNLNNHQREKIRKTPELKQAPVSDSVMVDITKNREPIVKRNPRGDVIYSAKYVGDEKFEYWVEYDTCARPLAYCDSRGYEWKCKYNTKGNISDFWDNRGYTERYCYYANNLIVREDSFGNKVKKHIPRDKFITRETFLKAQ